MSLREKVASLWKDDRLMQDILRNTGYLFSSNTISMGLAMLQSILSARLLGVSDLGVLGTVTGFAATVNRLFSFRMGELVVKHLHEYLSKQELDKARALTKAAFLVEAAVSVLAFVLVYLLAPLAAVHLAKDINTTIYFRIYGISVLGSLVAETSVGILQVDNRFRGQAVINVAQSILTAAVIAAAFFTQGSLMMVVLAYLLGKILLGIGPAVLAVQSANRLVGKGWWKAPLNVLPDWKELGQFALSTNLSATVNLVVRDSEVLWVAYFLSPLEAGYYKIALAIVNFVIMPITPFISTTYPQISRSVAEKDWSSLRRVLRRVTMISGGWTVATTLGLAIFGHWVILIYGAEYLPAYPALMVLLMGYGVANTLFWNRPLLLAFGMASYPFWVMLWSGIAKVLLAFPLVPRLGYIGEAALLSGFFILSVWLIVQRGLQELRRAEQSAPQAVEA